jgi:CheY-like chemotaxis protein
MSDRKLLKQVLLNLLNNAIKYNRQGGSILVKTETKPKYQESIVSVRISVTDTGLGIHPEDIAKLFLPFERIGAEKTRTEGVGLGLAIVKKIVIAMGGSVGVDSIVEQGSTFWIELPVPENQMSQTPQDDTNFRIKVINDDAIINAMSGTILYVEDNPDNAALVTEIIETHRPEINVIISPLGGPAVKLAIEYMPDLILLDLDLPDIKGNDVLNNLQIEEKTKSIPVVILTADATERQIEELMTAGASDYLTKPIDISMFLKVVDDTVEIIKT